MTTSTRRRQVRRRVDHGFALQENSDILTDIPTENEILGIYRRNSEETTVRRNIPRKFRGKLCSSEKTDEFRGNIIAVGEPLGDFTKFRGNSDELVLSVGIPSEFRRNFLGMSAGFKL